MQLILGVKMSIPYEIKLKGPFPTKDLVQILLKTAADFSLKGSIRTEIHGPEVYLTKMGFNVGYLELHYSHDDKCTINKIFPVCHKSWFEKRFSNYIKKVTGLLG